MNSKINFKYVVKQPCFLDRYIVGTTDYYLHVCTIIFLRIGFNGIQRCKNLKYILHVHIDLVLPACALFELIRSEKFFLGFSQIFATNALLRNPKSQSK